MKSSKDSGINVTGVTGGTALCLGNEAVSSLGFSSDLCELASGEKSISGFKRSASP